MVSAPVRALRGWLLLSILGLGVGGCAREKCAPAPPAEQLEPLPPPNDPAPADAPGEGEARYHLEQVADGLWAALQPDPLRYYDSNSVIIETSAGLVVVDAQSQLDAVAWLVDEPSGGSTRPSPT